jgi:hypothetical protein
MRLYRQISLPADGLGVDAASPAAAARSSANGAPRVRA